MPVGEVTQLLSQLEHGEVQSAADLLPLVYAELRRLAAARLARENGPITLQPTALVHEAYLRLVGDNNGQAWDNRGHFFAAAAEAMRRILLNRARDKSRLKRGGGQIRIDLDQIEVALDTRADDLIALDEAIQQLAAEDQACADLVKLRFFGGLSHTQAAQSLGISRRIADRHWAYARVWLFERLRAQ